MPIRVFLCEKELQAKDVAEALVPVPKRAAGAMQWTCGNDIVIWASGHLLEQAKPEDYDERYGKWRFEDLPIIPETWKLKPRDDKRSHIDTIVKTLKNATSIVHACDSDREGQLIGDELIRYAGIDPHNPSSGQPSVERLDLHLGNDKAAIQKALNSTVPNKSMELLSRAAEIRQQIDWVYGYNMTRAYSILARQAGYDFDEKFTVGRVRTPTLNLVVERDLAIESFTEIVHYTGVATVRHPAGEYEATWQREADAQDTDESGRTLKRSHIDDMADRVRGLVGRVSSYVHRTDIRERPALPLSLSELQKQASQRFHLTATQTLAAAQSLYEKHKLITYPRSSCRYLPSAMHAGIVVVLHAISRNDSTLARLCNRAQPHIVSSAWDDTKVGSHYAIIPQTTLVNFALLTQDEKNVYDIVARAFVSQFYPDAEYEQTEVEVSVSRDVFSARSREITSQGWRECYPPKVSTTKPLPRQAMGDRITIVDVKTIEKKTEPPKRYTEGTLIADMISIGKRLDDVTMRQALVSATGENAGIGTEATRASIIEDLVSEKSVERRNRDEIHSTRLGRNLIEALPLEARSAAMTALYEINLEQIATGTQPERNFLEKQRMHITELVRNARVAPPRRDPTDPDAGRRQPTKQKTAAKTNAKHESKSSTSTHTPQSPRQPS